LKQARYTSRDVFNRSIELKRRGLSRTKIQQYVTPDDYLANNKCAVVGKALATWRSYQELRSQWLSLDNPDDHPEPGAPSTDKDGAFPLVMAHGEGYRLSVRDDGRVGFRISPKPHQTVNGVLQGQDTDLSLLKETIKDSEGEIFVRAGRSTVARGRVLPTRPGAVRRRCAGYGGRRDGDRRRHQ
jgi:putative transposase